MVAPTASDRQLRSATKRARSALEAEVPTSINTGTSTRPRDAPAPRKRPRTSDQSRRRQAAVGQCATLDSGTVIASRPSDRARDSALNRRERRPKRHQLIDYVACSDPSGAASRSACFHRGKFYKKLPEPRTPARGLVSRQDVKVIDGVRHYIWTSDVAFEEQVRWIDHRGTMLPRDDAKMFGAAARKVLPGQQRARHLPTGTRTYKDTGIPLSTAGLPGTDPWILADGTYLFPSLPGAVTEMKSFDGKTVFAVMDVGSCVPLGGDCAVPAEQLLEDAHRRAFPTEYARLDRLTGPWTQQPHHALAEAIRPASERSQSRDRSVQSELIEPPWHCGCWMKYGAGSYPFECAHMTNEPGARPLTHAVRPVLEHIGQIMENFPAFKAAHGAMSTVCANVRRMPDIGRHGGVRAELALSFLQRRKPGLTMDDLLGSRSWYDRAAERVVADAQEAGGQWSRAAAEARLLDDLSLRTIGPGQPSTLLASSDRSAIHRGLQTHKHYLEPASSLHTTVAFNSFQVSGYSIRYHFDNEDLEIEVNVVIPFGDFELGHLHLPEYNCAVEVRPGQALFFYGRKTLHGTYKSAVRGVRNSVNAFSAQKLAIFGYDAKATKHSKKRYIDLATDAIISSVQSIRQRLAKAAVARVVPSGL